MLQRWRRRERKVPLAHPSYIYSCLTRSIDIEAREKLTLLNLPTEILNKIVNTVEDEVGSVCLGLCCKTLYSIHRTVYDHLYTPMLTHLRWAISLGSNLRERQGKVQLHVLLKDWFVLACNLKELMLTICRAGEDKFQYCHSRNRFIERGEGVKGWKCRCWRCTFAEDLS